ncbi:MAG: GNAT family N-acetyltransferase [Clostridia bacterium]|nr:GNAT family N-acetyltransferase [Clostridia bacterium]
MEIIKYNKKYKKELNSWQDKEKQLGLSGLEDFVVVKGTLLGDYLELIDGEMDIVCKLALEENALVGFVCYEKRKGGEYHIEIMGVNPDCRGRGYSQRLLTALKELLSKEDDFRSLSLSVNVRNTTGQKAFDKVGKAIGISDNENYIEYEI